MSFNGSGTFVVNSAGQPVVTGTTITSTAFNLLTADLATGLSTTLTKDGQSTPTANIPMGSFKLTGLANGTLAADAVRMSQLQSNGANYITVAGTADVITGGVTPALTAYAAGNEFVFVVGSTNTTSVTLNVDGLGAKAITKDGTGALTAGDLTAGDVALVVYDGTRFQLVSASYGVSSWAGGTTGLTPASATTGAVSLAGTLIGANGGTGVANTGKTITLGGSLTTSGAYASTLTATGTTAVTLPTTGTLATLAGSESLTNKKLGSLTTNGPIYTSGSDGTLNSETSLGVARGGTGAATLTANNVLLGNGTSAVQVVAPGTSGNLLTSNGTTWSSTAPAAGGVTTWAGGTTGLTPAGATSGAVSLAGTLAVANGGTGGTTSTGTGAVVLATNPALVGYTVNTASGVDGEWTTAGLTVYDNGVTPQHDGPLHVMSGTAGVVSAQSGSLIVAESATTAYIQTLTGTDGNAGLVMGTVDDSSSARVIWQDGTSGDYLTIGTQLVGGKIRFAAGDNDFFGELSTGGWTLSAANVTAQHDSVLHVMAGSAGTTSTAFAQLTVEHSGQSGICFLNPDANWGQINWQTPGGTSAGYTYHAYIGYNFTSKVLELGTNGSSSNYISFRTANGIVALTLDSSQRMVALPTYSTTVGATNRDLYIDSTGMIGYVSSIEAAKIDVQPITDTAWLHALKPVSFKYRKKDADGRYTDEIDGGVQYGMVAEEVEAVRPDLCFYDDVADLDENGEKTETTHSELRGIQYSKLVPVLLREVQKLRDELNQMKVN